MVSLCLWVGFSSKHRSPRTTQCALSRGRQHLMRHVLLYQSTFILQLDLVTCCNHGNTGSQLCQLRTPYPQKACARAARHPRRLPSLNKQSLPFFFFFKVQFQAHGTDRGRVAYRVQVSGLPCRGMGESSRCALAFYYMRGAVRDLIESFPLHVHAPRSMNRQSCYPPAVPSHPPTTTASEAHPECQLQVYFLTPPLFSGTGGQSQSQRAWHVVL